ncbi:MAG TPA: hypothetical protein VLA37_07540 [Sphingomonadaceae bacterium]|nr:hypothetical protein [Sphingomonadaceae bacterium]
MTYADQIDSHDWRGRFRARLGERATGLVVALAIEVVLLLLLLSLGRSDEPQLAEATRVTTFNADNAAEEEPSPEPEAEPDAERPLPREATPLDTQPPPPVPATPPRPQVDRTPVQPRMSAFDLSNLPRPAPPRQPGYGPAAPANLPRDSERVGTMPNGEPLYRAEWYREPSDQMLGDYLSTAQGPGWGMIACRTEPQWKVVDCVALEERPANSRIARAVLAAAWEFQVRPPRLGGKYQYGEWVRIRIDYNLRRNTGFQPQD